MDKLPDDIRRALEGGVPIQSAQPKPETIFIALPNTGDMASSLARRLLDYLTNPRYGIYIHFETGQMFHDFARNQCVKKFLETTCDWLWFIDSDVTPPLHAVTLPEHGHKIIAGSVFCFIKNNLLSSIWTYAPCEECGVVEEFVQKGTLRDDTQYRIDGDDLQRWNPFLGTYGTFATRRGGILSSRECRCRGTKLDPWVYRLHPGVSGKEPFECDSVGAACLMIHRSVFEEMPFPWFRHLYKQSGEILLTEDHFFAWKAKQHGFEIWAHPQVVCQHRKAMDLFDVNTNMVLAYEMGKKLEAEKEPSRIVQPFQLSGKGLTGPRRQR